MPSDFRREILALSSQQLRQVLAELQSLLNNRVRELYADDPETIQGLSVLVKANDGQIAIRALAPDTADDCDVRSDEKLRSFLLALGDMPAFEPIVRKAIERRLLASFSGTEPVLLATFVTLVLSIRWRLKIRHKDGKLDFSFDAEKGATPVSFIRTLLGLPGGTRSDNTDAPHK